VARLILALLATAVLAAVIGMGAAYIMRSDEEPPERPVAALPEPTPEPPPESEPEAEPETPAVETAPEPEPEPTPAPAAPVALPPLPPLPPAADEAASAQPPPPLLRLGTGRVTGVYFPAGGSLCRLHNGARGEDAPYCAVEATAGSVENLRRLRAGDLDLAVVQSDWQYHGARGTTEFSDAGPDAALRSLFSLHGEPLTVVAQREAGIRSFGDLKGKRVNLGPDGSGQRVAMNVALAAFDLAPGDLAAAEERAFAEQVLALCEGQVDAVAFAVGHPNGSVMDATNACRGLIVPVDGPSLAQKLEELPYLARIAVPGGFYPGNAAPVASFGVVATLVSRDTVSEAAVYAFVRAAFEGLDRLRAAHPAFAELDPALMIRAGLTAPLHRGAVRYYRERGWLDE